MAAEVSSPNGTRDGMETGARQGRCRRLLKLIPGLAERVSLAHDSPAMLVFRRRLMRGNIEFDVTGKVNRVNHKRLPRLTTRVYPGWSHAGLNQALPRMQVQAASGRMTLLAPFVEGIRMQPFSTCARSKNRLSRGGPFLNLAAAFVLALRALLSYDAMLGCVGAVFSVYLFCSDLGLDTIATRMDWNLVSMAVIFPISQCIGWSFARRESALNSLGVVTALTTRIWSAIHTWVVKDNGKWVPLVDLLDQPGARVRSKPRSRY